MERHVFENYAIKEEHGLVFKRAQVMSVQPHKTTKSRYAQRIIFNVAEANCPYIWPM